MSARDDRADHDDDLDEDEEEYEEFDPEGVPPMVELGQYPRLSVLVLRRRLESAGITTMVEWPAGLCGANLGIGSLAP